VNAGEVPCKEEKRKQNYRQEQTIFNKHKRKSGEAEWKRPDREQTRPKERDEIHDHDPRTKEVCMQEK